MGFDLPRLLQASLRDPRGVARALIRLNLPLQTGALALTLMAVLSALLSAFALSLVPIESDPAFDLAFASPLALLAMQGGVLAVTVMLIHGVGRMFGGTGRFSDALVLMAWIEAVLLVLQLLQLLLLLLAPPLSELAGLAAILAFLWLLSNFIAELHGFASPAAVLGAIIATVLAISLTMAIFAVAFLGVGA